MANIVAKLPSAKVDLCVIVADLAQLKVLIEELVVTSVVEEGNFSETLVNKSFNKLAKL